MQQVAPSVLGKLVRFALLLAVYFAAGKLGLKLAFVNSSASAVWPPTGIALAADFPRCVFGKRNDGGHGCDFARNRARQHARMPGRRVACKPLRARPQRV